MKGAENNENDRAKGKNTKYRSDGSVCGIDFRNYDCRIFCTG